MKKRTEMKKVKVLLVVMVFMLGLTLWANAQESRARSESSETEIMDLMRFINPDVKSGDEINELASTALNEWIDYLNSGKDKDSKKSFVNSNKDYTIICNIWFKSDAEGKIIEDVMFKYPKTLIIKNLPDENLFDTLQNSDEMGVSFYNFYGDGADLQVYILLIKS